MKKTIFFTQFLTQKKNNVLVKFSLSGSSTRNRTFFPCECFFSTWISSSWKFFFFFTLYSHRKKLLFPGDFFFTLGRTQENDLFSHEQKYIFSLSSSNWKKWPNELFFTWFITQNNSFVFFFPHKFVFPNLDPHRKKKKKKKRNSLLKKKKKKITDLQKFFFFP